MLTIKREVKRLLERSAPAILDAYRSINCRVVFGRQFRALHRQVREWLFQDRTPEVLYGPFRGLRYLDEIVWGSITPKWLGSYEEELHGIIDEIIAAHYTVILDIGCAEGYYAVGFAQRIPGAKIFAYDTDFLSRRQTRRLARLNGLDAPVIILGCCTGQEIARRMGERTLVFCDVEGFERTLLNPVSCPGLVRADILVEIHEENTTMDTLMLLRERFADTHFVREVATTSREDWIRRKAEIAAYGGHRQLLREAVAEHRPDGQRWLWMKAMTSGSAER